MINSREGDMNMWETKDIREIKRLIFCLRLDPRSGNLKLHNRYIELLEYHRDCLENIKRDEMYEIFLNEITEELKHPYTDNKLKILKLKNILHHIRYHRSRMRIERKYERIDRVIDRASYVFVFFMLFFAGPVWLIKEKILPLLISVIYICLLGLGMILLITGHAWGLIPIVIHALMCLALTIVSSKQPFSSSHSLGEGETRSNPVSGLFGGLNPAEAKAKYHSLLKKYHPDNYAGDLARTQRIIMEYDQYKACR